MGWVKWFKILNYFKSSQNTPLRFKTIKLVIILLRLSFLGRFEMLIKLVIFAKIAIIEF